MTQACPECRSVIPKEARVCPACAQRITGILCPDCLAFSPEGAKVCRHCQHRFKTDLQQPNTIRPFKVQADQLATLVLNWSLWPQKVSFTADKITVTSYGLLGLTSHDEEIPWEKIAGFSHRSGIFWDSISIETRGQSASVVSCLKKADAQRIRRVLQTLER